MFKRVIIPGFLSVFVFLFSSAPAETGRKVCSREVINAEWRFYKGEPSGSPEQISYDDSQWEKAGLPHCFNIPWFIDEQVDFGGTGWYRKQFKLDEADTSRLIFIEFEGVFQHCWVYVNGTLAGEHKGGYTGFTIDITEKVTFNNSNNVLAVKVSAEWDAAIAPRAGDHIFSGGIYRDVYIVTKAPLHIRNNGIVITTPFGGAHTSSAGYTLPVSYDTATVRVQIEIENKYSIDQNYYNRMSIRDADNTIVMNFPFFGSYISTGDIDTIQDSVKLPNPHFWSPSDPYLYTLHQELWVGCVPVDSCNIRFGIRWFQCTASDGFYLNGQKLYLRGFNVHQDHAGWATAVTNAGHYRDVKLCKDAGAVFIRGSHYPKDPAFVKACDELGICLMMEMCYWGKGGGTGEVASPEPGSADFTAFKENCIQQTQEMVRAFRNNPSVIIWSLTNEPTGGALNCNDLNDAVKVDDTTRPTCVVTNFVEDNLHGLENIKGQNGTSPAQSTMPSLWAELWETEEPARPGAYLAGEDDAAGFRLGCARWAGFDYGTHEDWQTTAGKPLNMVGMCDNYRIPKRRFYYLRNQWLGTAPPQWPQQGTPAKIRLTADTTVVTNDGTDDCQILVAILDAQDLHISNELEVTLKVVSGTGMFPTGDSIVLSTIDGLAAMEFRSYQPGQVSLKAFSGAIESDDLAITVNDAVVGINPFFLPDHDISGQIGLMLRTEISSGKGTRIFYRIPGTFSLSKKPVLGIYSIDGRLIEQIVLTKQSGMIHLGSVSKRSIPAGVFICRLVYGKSAAVTKSIIIH